MCSHALVEELFDIEHDCSPGGPAAGIGIPLYEMEEP
jgi:hypothetical protein